MTCALAPTYVVRWHYGFYPTTLLEHAIAATVLVFAWETWRSKSRLEVHWQLLWPAIALIAAAALDVAAAPNRVAALGLFRAYFIEPVAFAFVLINVMRTARRTLLVLAGLAVAGLAIGLPNAVLVLQALRAHTYDVLQTPPVVIYTTANAVALFLGPIIAVAAALVLYATERWVRAPSAVVLVLLGAAMLLTFSRGGYLAMAAMAIGLALSHRRRIWLLAGTAIVAVGLALIPPIYTRISVEFQNVGGTTFFGRAGRLELWSATLKMLQHYPIFGAGLSGFADRIGPYWNANHPERFIDPHNVVLNFWVETGVLGLVAFFWALVVVVRSAWTGWRRAPEPWNALSLGVLLAMVAVLFHGLVDVPYFKNDLSLEFWTLAAAAASAQRWAIPRPAPANPG